MRDDHSREGKGAGPVTGSTGCCVRGDRGTRKSFSNIRTKYCSLWSNIFFFFRNSLNLSQIFDYGPHFLSLIYTQSDDFFPKFYRSLC